MGLETTTWLHDKLCPGHRLNIQNPCVTINNSLGSIFNVSLEFFMGCFRPFLSLSPHNSVHRPNYWVIPQWPPFRSQDIALLVVCHWEAVLGLLETGTVRHLFSESSSLVKGRRDLESDMLVPRWMLDVLRTIGSHKICEVSKGIWGRERMKTLDNIDE